MPEKLVIAGIGAVTPVGLNAPQTVAAMRARLNGFGEIAPMPEPHAPIVGARVPSSGRLRPSRPQWLVNLAHRAAVEALGSVRPGPRSALFMSVPEPARDAPVLHHSTADAVFRGVQDRLDSAWHPASQALTGGRAAVFGAMAEAAKLFTRGEIDACLIGGVDSLVDRPDVDRLRHAGRLAGPGNPQGVLPGEGAAFFLLASTPQAGRVHAHVLGIGLSTEPQAVGGSLYATGKGLRQAIGRAGAMASMAESQVDFRVSDMNGERYAALESMIVGARAYRTRRERLVSLWPASSVGDLGAAAGALLVVCAVMEGRHPRGPGQVVMCESSSDDGLRGAALLRVEARHP